MDPRIYFTFQFALLIFVLNATAQDRPKMILREDPRADTASTELIIDSEPEPITLLQSLIVYPYEARLANLEGKVVISGIIDTNGTVVKVRVDESTNKIFEEPAKQALMNCRFKPAYQKGKPIKVWYTIPISFRLPQD